MLCFCLVLYILIYEGFQSLSIKSIAFVGGMDTVNSEGAVGAVFTVGEGDDGVGGGNVVMLGYFLNGFDFVGISLLRGLENRDYFCVGVFSLDVANEGFVVFAE